MSIRTALTWITLIAVLLVAFAALACGDDDDDDSGATDDGSTTSSEASDDDNDDSSDGDDDDSDDGESASGGAGTGTIEITGVERFTFSNITCQFGTGIIRGAGKSDDGTDAFVQASFEVDESGKPLNTPESAGILLKVGIAQLAGQPDYEWVLGDTAGTPGTLDNDGKRASGTAKLEYRNNNPNPPIPYGEQKDATFEFTCP